MLSTAIITIRDNHGKPNLCRALIDSGSQSNFITERIANLLKLPRHKSSIEVSGIGQSSTKTCHTVNCKIQSRMTSFSASIECIVLEKITQQLPVIEIPVSNLNIPANIQLADPKCHTPSDIDVLLGAELFYDIICDGKIKITETSPTLQNSTFGWIVSGKVNINIETSYLSTICNLTTLEELNNTMHRFWRVEESNGLFTESNRLFTGNDKYCEDFYKKTTEQNEDGRYCVKIPLKEELSKLGQSYDTALKRFIYLEKRLAKNDYLRTEYIKFMREYEAMQHMQQITEKEANSSTNYFIPHHAVIKDSSTTTKIRVVFDASCKTTSGVSLNDISIVGPTVQSSLINILLRFRTHKLAATADIEKMYRQILIHSDQTNLQLILWRENPKEPIKIYKLLTVTYGTASAPYLATRTLNQLANDKKDNFPKASQVMLNDFYVDDAITGGESVQELQQTVNDLRKLAKSGGFHLRKWCSNNPEVLKNVPNEDLEQKTYNLDQDQSIKTLGIVWNPKMDVLQFTFHNQECNPKLTKRSVLSAIGQIFDPLGIIGPVILVAKLLMQKLWECKIGWDDDLPEDIANQWKSFQQTIPLLTKLQIPRCITNKINVSEYEIHGFSDASEVAFGGCVYLTCIDSSQNVTSHLITSKSRVAPIKRVSLPRLELCGALLVAELTKTVIESLHLPIKHVHLYTDSTIVLAWIRAPSSHWTTFVANRVSKIQDLSDIRSWKHIQGSNNPADFLSRGLEPGRLLSNELYWEGPTFLKHLEPNNDLLRDQPTDLPDQDIPERRKPQIITCLAVADTININNYSTFSKTVRVMAYCIRFINGCKSSNGKKMSLVLTAPELQEAELKLIQITQKEMFFREMENLQMGKELNKRSQLSSLHPYLDGDGIIRVGGRLQNSNLQIDQRHPIVLPKRHKITELMMHDVHLRTKHSGPQSMLNTIRQKYWPLGGRNLARRIFHQCVRCFRTSPKLQMQLMGNLPKSRVSAPLRPFTVSGVDYCGPFLVKPSRKRGIRGTKCYICVFICFSCKAVHLELAEDMSTASFIAAMQRFSSRRGRPSEMYSDNGTNFVGAQKEIQQILNSEEFQTSIGQEGIKWHFQPPSAPNFGGLWESSVKLVKTHLKRIIGQSCLTIMEFITLLTEIEACVNSRPITPMSEEPSDLVALTPAHFLIGSIFTGFPEPNLFNIPENRLDHWQRVQQMKQHFWTRWSKDYLSNLQQRTKWKSTSDVALQPGSMVIVKESNSPPFKWPLARVVAVHPGSDSCVRVVTLRTPNGELKRPVNKLCFLPIEQI